MLTVLESPEVGRTWADVVHESLSRSAVMPLLAAALVVFLISLVFTLFAYRRAMLEKRSFRAFGGFLFESGAPPAAHEAEPSDPVAGAPSGTHSSAPPRDGGTGPLHRGTIAVARASLEIALARDEFGANERAGYLLTALVNATKHVDGNERRASILRVVPGLDGDEFMELAVGFPDALFTRPAARFSRRTFQKNGAGLCWAAVHACAGGHAAHSIKRNVFHAADVTKEPSFIAFPGHHPFQSILIAPVIVGDKVLGAVCLDSEQPSHYEESDQTLLAASALALGTAWHARSNAKGRG